MSALRVPLLCAFAGGCLSAAVVLAVWRAENLAAIPAQQQLARSNELLAAALSARNAEQRREVADNAAPPARVEPDHDSEAKAEPPASKEAEPAPAGSAVADVLTDLEAAYRKRLVAPAPADAPAPPAPSVASEPAPSAPPDPPPAPAAPAVVVAPAPVAPPAPVVVAVAPVPPPDVPPPAVAVAPPTMVAQNDVPPSVVHYGDVNQNTYITNVRQGDTYVTQQIALLQYMQLLGLSSAAGLGQPARNRPARGVGVRVAAQAAPQYKQFPSTLTNPDNPWGFSFAPPNLVH